MAVLAQRSLKKFVEFAWPWIEPREFRDNWHIDVICEHLEAINRGDIRRLLINIPPRHGKPVAADELVLTTRGRIQLRDVVIGDLIQTHAGRFMPVVEVFEQGVLPILKITTHSGRSIRVNDEHPLLTPSGWVQAQHLAVGDRLALVQCIEHSSTGMLPEEARLIGYFVGDGSCTGAAATITCFDEELAADIIHCAEILGFRANWSSARMGHRGRLNISGGVREWLRQHGLAGHSSHTKRVPESVMQGGKEAIANFIAAYIGCDGHVGYKGNGRSDAHVAISSVNRPLLADVQHLLMRLGVNARIRTRTKKGGTGVKRGDDYTFYVLETSSQDDIWRYQQAIPVLSEKGRRLRDWPVLPARFGHLAPDPIVTIERIDPAECRCLTVAEDHSFTVQDIAVHNSLIFSVFWPAWTWLQGNMEDEGGFELPTIGPGCRFLFASYSERLSLRDSLRTRTILKHPIFLRNYDVRISPSMDTKIRFDILGGGYRVATSVGGMATGEGGDILGVDDPHNVRKGESPTVREETVRWFAEVLPSRFNDPKRGAIGVIMQRVNERDVSGYILEKDLGYTHLCLPARFERNHIYHCKADRRSEEGEFLWKDRFGDAALTDLERQLGEYACTPAESPVLMADLTLKPIHKVQIGDEVVGFGVRPRASDASYECMMLKPAQVTAVYRYHAPVVKITLDSGEVIRCTPDHKWFKRVRPDGSWYSPATVGSPLARICPPHLPELSPECERLAGWLAGPVKWRDRLTGAAYGSKFITGHERVVSIETDGEEDVFALETTTGNYVVWGLASSNSAGQLQQRPAPREGGMFQRHWFKVVTELPAKRARVRSWDLAGSVAAYDPDFTAGVLMSKCDQGYYWVEDVVRFRATSHEVDRQMRAQAVLDGVRARITVPQDPGSAGKHHAEHMVRNLAGFQVKIVRPTGDKEVRAKGFAAQAEAGNVRILKASWNNEFLNELCSFPNGRFKDQVDASSDAFNELAETGPSVGSRPMRW